MIFFGRGNLLAGRSFTLTNSVPEEQGVNTRVYHLEDVARLAMGNFSVEELPPPSWSAQAAVKVGVLAASLALGAILGVAYLQ
jgi:hypothetical protein